MFDIRRIPDVVYCTRAGGVGQAITAPREAQYKCTISTERVCWVAAPGQRGRWEVLLSSGFLGWFGDDQVPMLSDHGGEFNARVERYLIGSVRHIHQEGDSLAGVMVFSSDADSQRVRTKIEENHIRSVSPSYYVLEHRTLRPGETAEFNGKRFTAPQSEPLQISTKWMCMEVSAVVLPANIEARIGGARSELAPHAVELKPQPHADPTEIARQRRRSRVRVAAGDNVISCGL